MDDERGAMPRLIAEQAGSQNRRKTATAGLIGRGTRIRDRRVVLLDGEAGVVVSGAAHGAQQHKHKVLAERVRCFRQPASAAAAKAACRGRHHHTLCFASWISSGDFRFPHETVRLARVPRLAGGTIFQRRF